jgi:hypothetical protein
MPFLYESVFLTLVLLAVVGLYLAWPFLTGPRRARRSARGQAARIDRPVAGGAAALEERHQQIVAALRDLEFDYKLAKITDEDYAVARAQLMAEGAQVLRALDTAPSPPSPARLRAGEGADSAPAGPQAGEESSDLEHEIAARRKHKAETRAAATTQRECPQCGRPSTPDDVFCPRCGARLPVKKVLA